MSRIIKMMIMSKIMKKMIMIKKIAFKTKFSESKNLKACSISLDMTDPSSETKIMKKPSVSDSLTTSLNSLSDSIVLISTKSVTFSFFFIEEVK